MEGQEVIQMIKSRYRPKEGYSLEICFNDGKYCYSIFKIKEIKDKKKGTIDIANMCILGGAFTRNKSEFKDVIETYCVAI